MVAVSPSGILLALAGVWIMCQVFGGNALGRLGIAGEPTEPGKKPEKRR